MRRCVICCAPPQTKGAIAPIDLDDPESGSGLIVLGMGKLGGRELNYSSDIDLILLYDPRACQGSAQDSAQSLFGRLARDLVRILDERTGDGYVFRTDLRLRPDPRSTPLAMSVAAALTYYESVGQNWERAALIKARPVAGDRAGAAFLAELRPFMWRKHLDFAAIEDIHSIKRQINAHRGGGRIAVDGHDIKIGRGGIREIEFFAQTQQLIWGGTAAPSCGSRRPATALRRARRSRPHRRSEPPTTLIADYRFLRRVEHRLQMVDDAQTHRLPGRRRRHRPARERFLAMRDADALRGRSARPPRLGREALCRAVRGSAEPCGGRAISSSPAPRTIPKRSLTLARLGFADPAGVAAIVRGWHHGRIRATRSQRAREILTELMPELLRSFGATAHPDTAFLRFDQFLARLPAGVQLFSLFYANPGLFSLVAEIMAEAPLLARAWRSAQPCSTRC